MLVLIFTTTNVLHIYYVNITSYETLERIITKPGKGNEVVILDQKLYNNAIQEIISGRKQKNLFNEIECNKLYPSGSASARMYGTHKIHKFTSGDSFPKRGRIVSSVGTFNYNLAHFLCDLLSPLVPNDNSCKDTFSFVSQIKNANLSRKLLTSYNVTSLFTNIPLQETIDVAI